METGVLVLKGVAFVGAGVCVSLATNLAQWTNSDEWPSRINWVVIIIGAAGAGFNALLSFMSSAYSEYRISRASGFQTDLFRKTPQQQPAQQGNTQVQ